MPRHALRTPPILALVALVAACGSSSPQPSTTTVGNRTHIDGLSAIASVIQLLSATQGAPSLDQFLAPTDPGADSDLVFYSNAIEWLIGSLVTGHELEAAELGYEGRALDAMGNPMRRKLSGAVFMPDPDGEPLSVPIVVYTHGTELKRSLVASRGLVASGYDATLGGAEGLIGAAFAAATPAIVLMPDFQGMGSDDDPTYYHPYVHRDSLAWAGHDMVTGLLPLMAAGGSFLPPGLSWNGKLYVMGYSEGGFAAMAFTREWQLQKDAGTNTFPLDCSVPMAGPHNLSGQMVPVMTNGSTAFAAPFFLPYVLYAYERIYPATVHADEALRPEYVTRNLRDMMSGRFSGGYVDQFIWNIGGRSLAMRSLMVEDWVRANLDSRSGPVFEAIAANDTVARQGSAGAWTNSMPMYLIHAKHDDLVPFGNSNDARGWLADGGGASVTLRTVNPRFALYEFDPGHGAAAPYALVGGMYWIANGCRE